MQLIVLAQIDVSDFSNLIYCVLDEKFRSIRFVVVVVVVAAAVVVVVVYGIEVAELSLTQSIFASV